MGWFRDLIGLGSSQPRNESIDSFLQSFAGQYATSSGISVTSDSAVASVAVLACVLVRAESLMFCPVDVYRRKGKARESVDGHPVAALISRDPNPLITSEEMWRWKQITEDLTGNAYLRIEWDRGRPVALWPMYGLKPQLLRWKDKSGDPRISYRYAGDDFSPAQDYPAADVLHFRGPMLANPYESRSLVQVAAQHIGLDIASAEFFARFLSNGSHFPNYFETDSVLTKEDRDAFGQQFKDGAGLLPAGKVRLFDRGLKLKSNPMSLKDADLSSHQRWQLEQICRVFRVPPQMVQDLSHGTYTNSEQADLWLSKHTMAPIVKNTEGRIRKSLFLAADAGLYAKFNLDAMLRGDFQTRTAGYSILIQCGVLAPNEARALEDMNPYEGGDEYRVPLNTGPVGADLVPAAGNLSGGATRAMLAPLLADARDRVMARVGDNLRRGRPVEDSVAFARLVLEPIVATHKNLGLVLDVEAVARDWTHADEFAPHL